MATDTSKVKKYLIFGLIGCVLLLIAYIVAPRPDKIYPLGSALEYIGASYSGTVPLISDSSPSASYYYATDLSPVDVAAYFKKATLSDRGDLDKTNPFPPITFSLKSPTTDNPIDIYYYTDGSEKIRDFDLKETTKKHLIIIQNEDYKAAKDSL